MPVGAPGRPGGSAGGGYGRLPADESPSPLHSPTSIAAPGDHLHHRLVQGPRRLQMGVREGAAEDQSLVGGDQGRPRVNSGDSGCSRLDSDHGTVALSVGPPAGDQAAQNKAPAPVRHNTEHLRRTRLLEKSGRWNIRYMHTNRGRVTDLFTNIVEAKWRYTLLVFGGGFTMTWLLFTLVWYVIIVAHGDLDNKATEGWVPCVEHIDDFTSVFLFSLETQHTIGYGYRYINEACPEAVMTLVVQSVAGVLMQCIVSGLVFVKFSRSKKRAETLKFSRRAAISLRDDQLCLTFRIGDHRKTHLLSSTVKAQLISKRVTREGEVIQLHQQEVKVGLAQEIYMIWPMVIEHWIDADSPFYELGPDNLAATQFEMIVTLDGTVQSNGMSIQARTSYLPNEILWGHRFKRLVSWDEHSESYVVDHEKFHSLVEVPCPRLSARALAAAGGVAALGEAQVAAGQPRGTKGAAAEPELLFRNVLSNANGLYHPLLREASVGRRLASQHANCSSA